MALGLSRDQGDFATLVKLFDCHGVKVHSVNEGDLDLASASGRMQIGVHGVIAQYYRDQIVENTRMRQRQAAEQGRWLNRAPTSYDIVAGQLIPNEMAPLVRRIFDLRAASVSFPMISDDVSIEYSTAHHISMNRVYLSEVRLGDDWLPGQHLGRSLTRINSTRLIAATPPVNDAARTSSRGESAVTSVDESRASTTTIAIKRSIDVDIEGRAVPSPDVPPMVCTEPLCSVYECSRVIQTCKQPFESSCPLNLKRARVEVRAPPQSLRHSGSKNASSLISTTPTRLIKTVSMTSPDVSRRRALLSRARSQNSNMRSGRASGPHSSLSRSRRSS